MVQETVPLIEYTVAGTDLRHTKVFLYYDDAGNHFVYIAPGAIGKAFGFQEAALGDAKVLRDAGFEPRKLLFYAPGLRTTVIIPNPDSDVWKGKVTVSLRGTQFYGTVQKGEQPSQKYIVNAAPAAQAQPKSTAQQQTGQWLGFAYTADDGSFWAFDQWSILADQLNCPRAYTKLPLLQNAQFRPRQVVYLSLVGANELRLIYPYNFQIGIENLPKIGWNGLIYVPYQIEHERAR